MKRSWLSLCVPIVACLAQTSLGAAVTFSPSGTGANTVQVGVFAELPGNALAQGAQTAINGALTSLSGTAAGTQVTTGPFTLYYQANLNLVSPGATGTTIDTSGYNFTAVAQFQETATVTQGSNTVVFNLAANQSGSYLDFFATHGNVGNNATGANFANSGSTLIYVGSVASTGSTGNFTNNGGSTQLDSYTPSGTQQSVSGFGGTTLNFSTLYANSNYFVTAPGPMITFTTENVTPFSAVVPSSQFNNLTQNGTTITSYGFVTPNLGTLNGSPTGGGSDFQFQVYTNTTFTPFAAVPEPASIAMTLLGLGGAGLGTVVCRRRARVRAAVA